MTVEEKLLLITGSTRAGMRGRLDRLLTMLG